MFHQTNFSFNFNTVVKHMMYIQGSIKNYDDFCIALGKTPKQTAKMMEEAEKCTK